MKNHHKLLSFTIIISAVLSGCSENSGEKYFNQVDPETQKIIVKSKDVPVEDAVVEKTETEILREEMQECKDNQDSIVADMNNLLKNLEYEKIMEHSKKCSYWIGSDTNFKSVADKAILKLEEKNLEKIAVDDYKKRLESIKLIVSIDPKLKLKYSKEITALEKIKKLNDEKEQEILDAQNSKWRISYDTSPIDDSKTVTLAIDADSDIDGWLSEKKNPTLILRCKEKKTDFYIVTGMQPNVEYGTFGATIILRIDKSPAYKVHASKSTDGEALFLPAAVTQIKKLMNGRELYFQFNPFNYSPQSTKFQLAGLKESIKPLREVCSW